MTENLFKKWRTTLTGSMAKKGYLSIIDQTIVSGCNFLTVALLGRHFAPKTFGVFILIWTTLMIVQSIQNALVCTPMSVIGSQKPPKDIVTYWGSLFTIQFLLSFAICLIILVVCLLLKNTFFLSGTTDITFSVLTVALFSCFFFQLQEFFRRLLIVKLKLWDALLNDAATSFIRLGGLFFLLYAGLMNLYYSLAVIGMGFMAGSALGYLGTRKSMRLSSQRLLQDFFDNWRFGKWVLAEMLPYILSVQGYLYITAFMVGAKQTAALGASQNILNATNILIMSFSNLMTPVAARRYIEGGNKALTRLMIKAGALIAVPILCFYLLTMAFAEEILNIVYKQNYSGYGQLLIICGFYFVVSLFNRFLQIQLYAKNKPDIGFLAKTASLFVMISLAFPLINKFGVYGAATGTVISQLVVFVGFFAYLKRNINRGQIS